MHVPLVKLFQINDRGGYDVRMRISLEPRKGQACVHGSVILLNGFEFRPEIPGQGFVDFSLDDLQKCFEVHEHLSLRKAL